MVRPPVAPRPAAVAPKVPPKSIQPDAVRSASRAVTGAAAAAAAQVAANSLPRPVPSIALPPALPPGGMVVGVGSLLSDRLAAVGVAIALAAMMGGLVFTVGILNSVDEHLDRVDAALRQANRQASVPLPTGPKVDVTAIENRLTELQDQIDVLKAALKQAQSAPAAAPSSDTAAALAELADLRSKQESLFRDLRKAVLEDIQKNYGLQTELLNQDRKCFSNLVQIGAGLSMFLKHSPPDYPPVGQLVRGVLEWPSRKEAPLAGAWALPICPRQMETFTDKDLAGGVVWDSSYQETITPLVPGMPPNKPVAWDRRPVHEGSRHVLFFDGHVELVSETQFQQLLVQFERR